MPAKRIGGAIMAILIIGLIGIMLFHQNTPPLALRPALVTSTPSAQDKTASTPTSAGFTSPSAIWITAQFPPEYRHAIDFQYPDNWFFHCCGDTDAFSAHLVSPIEDPRQVNQIHPHVLILDHVLMGCPKDKQECSIDEAVKLRPEEQLKNIRDAFAKEDADQKLLSSPDILLPDTSSTVYVYRGSAHNIPVRIYLFATKTDVVQLRFYEPDRLGAKFIEKFINSITMPVPLLLSK